MKLGPFVPSPLLAGRHLQTIAASRLPSPEPGGRREWRLVEVEEGCRVRVDIARPEGVARGTILFVHGLAGCSESAYMRWGASEAIASGWAAARMNLRGAAGSASMTRSLYNAGQQGDVGRVLAELAAAGLPRPFVVAGFSLGGNLALLHAARSGEQCLAEALVAVNPPVDLDLCCRAIERRSNVIYRYYFIEALCRHIEAARPFVRLPGPRARPFEVRTLRRFDEMYTAPHAGYASVDEYYALSSAGPRLGGVRVPTLVVSAADDPFVPLVMFERVRAIASTSVRFEHPLRGGHCGYRRAGRRPSWIAARIVAFAEEQRERSRPRLASGQAG